MNGPQRVVLGAWLAMIGLATARSLSQGRGLPEPSVYLGSGVLFTAFFAAAAFLGPFPAILAVGADVSAVLLPYYQGGNFNKDILGPAKGPLDQVAQSLDKISGGSGVTSGGGQGNLTP